MRRVGHKPVIGRSDQVKNDKRRRLMDLIGRTEGKQNQVRQRKKAGHHCTGGLKKQVKVQECSAEEKAVGVRLGE